VVVALLWRRVADENGKAVDDNEDGVFSTEVVVLWLRYGVAPKPKDEEEERGAGTGAAIGNGVGVPAPASALTLWRKPTLEIGL
jgi:hypothetical protein